MIGKFAGLRAALLLGAAFVAPAADADVVISSVATANMDCTAGICAPTASDAVLNVTDLENLLASGNVEVTTTGAGVQAGNLEIDAPFGWSESNALTLDAYGSIRVKNPVSVAGPGGLSIVTNDGGSGGQLWFGPKGNVAFAGTSNALSINGAAYTLEATLPDLAAAIKANTAGNYALAQDYNAGQRGDYHSSPISTIFEGSLNGLGNTISNLHIVGKTRRHKNRGLFTELDTPSSVSSLRLTHLKLEAEPTLDVGGVTAFNYGLIFNSMVIGVIDSDRSFDSIVGAISGVNVGTLDDDVASISAQLFSKQAGSIFAGGLSGSNAGLVSNSFAQGTIDAESVGETEAIFIGGLIGINGGSVENCYATGSSTETNPAHAYVGGLIGDNLLNVATSYSTGIAAATEGADSYVGGLIGFDQSADNGGTIADTYWDTTTSGVTDLSDGAGNIANDPGINGRTTEQLQKKLPKGFDPAVWTENKRTNNGLPWLIDNPPGK